MKYDRVRKTERNQEVLRFYRERKDMTLAEIGDHFGISTTRVHQLVVRAKELEAQREAAKGESQ